jgi:glycosyltransferase involved in cell wall biosynthesis
MNVLYLVPQSPYPPRSGPTIRNLSLLKGLAAARHRVTTVTFSESTPIPGCSPAEIVRALEPYGGVELAPLEPRTKVRRVLDLRRTEPDLARRLVSDPLVSLCRHLLAHQRFDLVHIGGLEMAASALALDRGGAVTVLDEHNAEYLLQKRNCLNELRLGGSPIGLAYSAIQWKKLEAYERMVCRAADAVVAVSEPDAAALRTLAPDIEPVVVPNPIDVREYTLPSAPTINRPPVLLFTGTMDYRPNIDAVVWLCHQVLPRLRVALPGVRIQIVGQRPAPAVRRLAELPGVEVVGAVPDDRPYLRGADLYVVPMRVGGGIRLKILQAMASGVPVVATSLAYEGIAATPGEHLAVGDSPAEFARAVVALVEAPERRARMVARARALVESSYDWRIVVPRLVALYERLVAGKRDARPPAPPAGPAA